MLCSSTAPYFIACYDTDPVQIDAEPSVMLPEDAGPCEIRVHSEVEALSPTCASQQARCLQVDICLDIMHCIREEDCFYQATFQEAVACGTPCAFAAGVTTADDPAVGAGFPLLECIATSCESACR
jgi:hypothetical protein